jgi:hypothetical protein
VYTENTNIFKNVQRKRKDIGRYSFLKIISSYNFTFTKDKRITSTSKGEKYRQSVFLTYL